PVQVSSDELNRAPAEALEQALQGKVPGAIISMNSGAPGGGGQVQIRGITSILGAGQPLFVVDGVIISNDAVSDGANSVTGAGARTTAAGIGSSQDALVNRLADLNMQEIASVEVLKSAAATAMYGSRATNGVIVAGTGKAWPEWLDGDEGDSHCEAIGLCEESPQLFFWPQRASVRGGGSKRAGTLEWPCRRLRWNPPRSRTRKGRRSRPRQVGLME